MFFCIYCLRPQFCIYHQINLILGPAGPPGPPGVGLSPDQDYIPNARGVAGPPGLPGPPGMGSRNLL